MCGEHLSFMAFLMVSAGSSPHVRGARHHLHKIATRHGIIPACAGSTFNASFGALQNRDHPRMCGEHAQGQWAAEVRVGLSPHVRGAHRRQPQLRQRAGIIPACAGSTVEQLFLTTVIGDHPRMCGEHTDLGKIVRVQWGSSPHVRGAPYRQAVFRHRAGIIPACAGSTHHESDGADDERDHPRMCGEHFQTKRARIRLSGSSPHVRGAPHLMAELRGQSGIIPACAGSTALISINSPVSRDHPRMCGEHFNCEEVALMRVGSSPHVRGAHLDRRLPRRESGIIPACAGSTWPASPPWHSSWDHPRMCGEHFIFGGDLPLTEGSSPHVRGAP